MCEGEQRMIIIKTRPNGVKRRDKNSSFSTARWLQEEKIYTMDDFGVEDSFVNDLVSLV